MLLVDIKGYNDWWENFFDQLIRNVIKIYQNITKKATEMITWLVVN